MPLTTICNGDAPSFQVLQSLGLGDLPANIPAMSLGGNNWTAPGPIGGTTPGSGAFTAISATGQITSTVATGTAPLVVASTTMVVNLNAASLGGATFAAPGAIGGTTASTGKFTSVTGTSLVLNGLATTYNSIATTGQGLPALVGIVTTGTHTAAIAATNLLAAPVAGGFYRISAYMKVTVATSTPVAGPITITYKDSDGVAQSVVMMLQNAAGSVATGTGSTTTTPVFGSIDIYCGSGTAIQYAVAFSGTGTYELVLKCESF